MRASSATHGETVDDEGERAIEGPLKEMLDNLRKETAEAAKAASDAAKASRAPRRTKLIRDEKGRLSESVSMVEG